MARLRSADGFQDWVGEKMALFAQSGEKLRQKTGLRFFLSRDCE